jgi:DNA-binding transcriptional MerR regulator
MKLGELAERSGCSTATIKYYLREGLLEPGARRSATDADYDEGHLRRLRMIRVLRDVGDLPIAAIGAVLAAMDDHDRELHDVLATAVHALGPRRNLPPREELEPIRSEVLAWVEAHGWEVSPDAPALDLLAVALRGARQFWGDTGPEIFERYLLIADTIGEGDLRHIDPIEDMADTIRQMTVGTVVWEQALIALRRLADEHHSRKRFRAPRGA